MFKKIKFYIVLLAVFLAVPLLSYAQPGDLIGLIGIFMKILGALVPLMVALALVGFLWGAARYVLFADDAAKRKEGSTFMLYGIIALFVIISVWGLVEILGATFDVDVRFLPQLPGGRGIR